MKRYIGSILWLVVLIGCTTEYASTTLPPSGTEVIVQKGTAEPSVHSQLLPPMELAGAVEIPTDLVWPMYNKKLSPNGETLVGFTSTYRESGFGDLVVIDLTTWITRQITYDDGMKRMDDLFWSPDNHTIGFSMSGNPHEIWLMDIYQGEKRFFAEGEIATWSPDGQRIAVADYIDTPSGETTFVLRILDLDSGKGEEVFQQEGVLQCYAGLAWSPDGRYIALSWSEPSTYESMLYVLDLETREAKPMMANSIDHGSLGWTADGEWLAVGFAGGAGTTWFVRWDGACWVRPPELEDMSWIDFSGQSAKALALQNRVYIIDLYEAFGPDFPTGVILCP
jgi:hypothetical protein